MPRSRFPRAVFGVGDDPDARFTLANERTFLAWNRTALALLAGGVALEAFGLDVHAGLRLTASLLLIVAGIVIPVTAWFDWVRSERALRLGQGLPGARTSLILAVVIVLAGLCVLLGVLLR